MQSVLGAPAFGLPLSIHGGSGYIFTTTFEELVCRLARHDCSSSLARIHRRRVLG